MTASSPAAPDARTETIRQAFRYAPGIHHNGCDTHIGKPCDCYYQEQAKADAALASLDAELQDLRRMARLDRAVLAGEDTT